MYVRQKEPKKNHRRVRIRQRTFLPCRDVALKYYSSKLVIINVLHRYTLLLIILLIFECCRMLSQSFDLTSVARITLLDYTCLTTYRIFKTK